MSAFAEPNTPSSLMIELQRGSAGLSAVAWQRFVQLYGPVVYRWIRKTGASSSDAADVTQDVMASVHRDIERFDRHRPNARFRAWLWTITKRRIADHTRRQGPEQLLGSAVGDLRQRSESSDPPTDAASDRVELLRRGVVLVREHFEEKTWTAFWSTVVEARSPDEVAETLGLSRWAVYKARARVLQRLRSELEGLVE